MQQHTLHRKRKESPAFLDLQMTTRTNIMLHQKEVVACFVKAMSHYKDKEMLVILLNMGNHWILLSISTTYDLVWYCDPSRLIHLKTSDQLTCDVISILDE
jgi:hypothetical protein